MATLVSPKSGGVPFLKPDDSPKKSVKSDELSGRSEFIWAVALGLFFVAFFGFVVWLALNSPLPESSIDSDPGWWYMGP